MKTNKVIIIASNDGGQTVLYWVRPNRWSEDRKDAYEWENKDVAMSTAALLDCYGLVKNISLFTAEE